MLSPESPHLALMSLNEQIKELVTAAVLVIESGHLTRDEADYLSGEVDILKAKPSIVDLALSQGECAADEYLASLSDLLGAVIAIASNCIVSPTVVRRVKGRQSEIARAAKAAAQSADPVEEEFMRAIAAAMLTWDGKRPQKFADALAKGLIVEGPKGQETRSANTIRKHMTKLQALKS